MIIGQKQWGKLIKLHDSIYIGVWESWYPVPQYRRVPLLEQDTQPSLEVGDCLGLVLTGVPCKGRSQFHISHLSGQNGASPSKGLGHEQQESQALPHARLLSSVKLPLVGMVQGEASHNGSPW